MKNLKITFFLACAIITLGGCLGNTGTEPTLITDPSATSHLAIANQTGLDLTVSYRPTEEYEGLDSTVTLPIDSTTLIFEPGGFSFPTPSEALAKLTFYTSSGDTEAPIFNVEPIADEDWDDVTAEEDSVKKYELVITEQDLNN